MEPLLRCINLSKSYGALPVLRQVSFAVNAGEVVGLAGRSGSGKSVLAMLLAGVERPSEGDMYIAGQRLRWPINPRVAGVSVIHQRPELAERLDITANVFLGGELGWPAAGGWLRVPNRRRMDQRAAEILDQLEVHFTTLREKVSNLSSEQRQMIAIARALVRPARLVVVDEPTMPLSYGYQQRLLDLIRQWQQQGVAVIFASNNLDHLFAVADRIVVLRQGYCVADYRTDTTGREEVVSALVGTTDRQQLTPIMWALDSYYRAREQAEKLGHQQTLLEQNLAVQDSLNRQLIDKLAEQVSALDRANLALQDAQRRLLTEREQERKSLARELHDQVIQDLLSINYQLEEIEAEAEQAAEADELAEVRTSIRALVDDVRRICGNLRPPTIDSLGLGSALQSFTRDWSARSGVGVALDLDARLGRLPEAIELSIFRIVQEGLSNVRKHARASAVQISLKHTSPRTLLIAIADNGRGLPAGFDLAGLAADGHYGLLGISERVALLEGRLHVQNQPGGGALLQAEIPHPRVEIARTA
ncbi:MAG TPA: ATP-binding cassette domain-containing protein [Kouleothrix sp.]|uniref:ATP-binding cassette domain-containing protein n=1 Tax=Kouleothrix sp. TaxID=2779161 RepID=UPI002B86CDF8|nr:ATP-binding cassette domain-containing protein [Kouleothrix sp.]HRC74198.1 ATP-binding cassette domain-containing protein [Kouleothrix sp.]